jgi:hypothetical protein
MIGVGGDFKALMTVAFDVMLLFDIPDHVLADMMALLCKVSMQTLITITFFTFSVSSFDQQLTVVTLILLSADITT